jgi:gliding motility associated protien GldN
VRRVPRKDNTSATATTSNAAAKNSSNKSENTKSSAAKNDNNKVASSRANKSQNASNTRAAEGENTSAPVKRTTATPKKSATTLPSTVDDNSLRAQAFDAYQKRDEQEPSWQRTVYRELDVTQGSNASLYYPVEPTDGLTNFFRVILDLVVSGKVKGYEYLDGREVFSDKYTIQVEDMLNKFQIYYTSKPAAGRQPATIEVDENDVPSNEVLSYFVKERWEFDRTTSRYGARVLAICPVLHRAGDFGGEAFKYPMFWLNYEDLRPYLRRQLIVSDGMNAAPRYTMEDFFTLNQYQGDIYKVQNLRGLSLMQQYTDADTLRVKRAELDRQLTGFADSIWVREPDPTVSAPASATTTRRSTATRVAATRTVTNADKGTTTVTSTTSEGENVKLNRRTKETVDLDAVQAEKDAKAAELEQKAERTGAAHSVRRSR